MIFSHSLPHIYEKFQKIRICWKLWTRCEFDHLPHCETLPENRTRVAIVQIPISTHHRPCYTRVLMLCRARLPCFVHHFYTFTNCAFMIKKKIFNGNSIFHKQKTLNKTNNRCPSALNYKNAQPTIGSDNRQSTNQSQRRNTSTLHLSQLQTVIRGKKCPVLYNVQCFIVNIYDAHTNTHTTANFIMFYPLMTKIDMVNHSHSDCYWKIWKTPSKIIMKTIFFDLLT